MTALMPQHTECTKEDKENQGQQVSVYLADFTRIEKYDILRLIPVRGAVVRQALNFTLIDQVLSPDRFAVMWSRTSLQIECVLATFQEF